MRGVQHHVTFPKSIVEPSLFEDGKMFDGSSISGWKGINESDMVLDAAHVDDAQVDELDLLILDEHFDVFDRHGNSGCLMGICDS
jgi:glutamine synthetase